MGTQIQLHGETMNYALPFYPPIQVRSGLLLMLCVAFLLASAVSVAPTLGRLAIVARAASQPQVCKCAHCPGGIHCCCRMAGKCPTP